MIEDEELTKNIYIWNDVSNSIKEEFDSEPIYNKRYLKTKRSNEAADFHDKEIPEVVSNYTCLAIVLIDFVLKKVKNITRKCF